MQTTGRTRRGRFLILSLGATTVWAAAAAAQTTAPSTPPPAAAAPSAEDFFKLPASGSTAAPVAPPFGATPTGDVFDQGVQFLDAPLMQNPELLFKKSGPLAATQPGNAWLGLCQAATRAPADAPYRSEALAKAAELKTQYLAEVEACRAAVEAQDATALMKVRAALKKWGAAVDDQLVRLDNQLKPAKK